MQSHKFLPILACVAAASFGVYLWLSGAGSSKPFATASSIARNASEPNASGESRADLEPLEEAEPDAPRSNVDAEPSENVAAEEVSVLPAQLSAVSNGSVRGRVIDQDGVTMPSVKVSLHLGQVKTEKETDAQGRFVFDGLKRGVYRLYVDGRSLPAGYLPPWRQQAAREPADNPSGVFGTTVRLTEGSDRDVDLRVFAAASVSGRLVGPEGEPIAGTPVSIRSATGVTQSALTDARGRFAMAQVYPGAYSANVKLDSNRAESGTSSPLPLRFEVAPRESRVLPDLVAGAGGHILRGSVVDTTGRPVVGQRVVCKEIPSAEPAFGWEAVTDDAGRYEIGRVPSTTLLVTAQDEIRTLRGGKSSLEDVDRVQVDTREAPPVVELRPIEVEPSHVFHLVARVRVDSTWAAENRFEPWTVQVDVREPSDPSMRTANSQRPGIRLAPHAADEFTWSCPTPHSPMELRVVLRNSQGASQERREIVRPAADATQEVLVAFP